MNLFLVFKAAVLEVEEALLDGGAFRFDGVERRTVLAGGGLAGLFLFVDLAFEFGDVRVGGGDFLVQVRERVVGGADGFVVGELAPAVAAEGGFGLVDELACVGQRQPVFRPTQPARDILDAGSDEIHDGREVRPIRPNLTTAAVKLRKLASPDPLRPLRPS